MIKRLSCIILVLLVGCQPEKQNPYLTQSDGYVNVEGGHVWYGILGEGDKTPYLLLHGGPGGRSRYGLLLLELSKERPVIMMDQLGGGLSSYHEDTTLLTIDNFVEQVRAVKEALNLNEFYLAGHSWGTALALEYYTAYPDGIKGIVFNSPYFSTSTWVSDTDTLISTLPDSIQSVIEKAEATGVFDTEEYSAANKVFSQNFGVRKPVSERLVKGPPSYGILKPSYDTLDSKSSSFIYNYMWGPSEFSPTGTLTNYENIDALRLLKIPVLFTTGEFDTARPSTVKEYVSITKNGELIIIPNAGHGSFVDDLELYERAHRDFANSVDEERPDLEN